MTEKDSEQREYEALARRFLDLWEEQTARLCSDPETLSLLKLTGPGASFAPEAAPWQLWQQGLAGMMEFWKAQSGERHDQSGNARESGADGKPAAGAAGAKAAAVTSLDRDAALGQLLDRLAAVEKRLAALERRLGRSGKSAAAGGKRKRSGAQGGARKA